MSDSEIIQMLSEIRDYLTAGNPVWDTDKVREAMNVAIQAIKDCPSADVVKVVRCKDCKKVETNNCPMYRAHFGYTDYDYCSCGELKEQENE